MKFQRDKLVETGHCHGRKYVREPLASTGPFKVHDMRAVNRRPWWLATIREMVPSKRGLGLVGAALAMDDAWMEHQADGQIPFSMRIGSSVPPSKRMTHAWL